MTAKIVYIDDEPMLCRAFAALLGSIDIAVETFTDPDAALAFIHAHEIALVFCDFRMPKVSGVEVLERIGNRDLSFYFVSGDPHLDDSIVNDIRVSGVLGKPYNPDELLTLVRSYVGDAPVQHG